VSSVFAFQASKRVHSRSTLLRPGVAGIINRDAAGAVARSHFPRLWVLRRKRLPTTAAGVHCRERAKL
jgi:hypothetical protein